MLQTFTYISMDRMEIHANSLQAFGICLQTYIYILDSIHVHFIT